MKISLTELIIGSSISLGIGLILANVTYCTSKPVKPIDTPEAEPTKPVTIVPDPIPEVVTTSTVQEAQTAPKPTPTVSNTHLVPLPKDDAFPLRLGSTGDRVWKLRTYLLRKHGAKGIVTNEFTPVTLEQVRKYLKVDTVNEALYTKLIDPIQTIR